MSYSEITLRDFGDRRSGKITVKNKTRSYAVTTRTQKSVCVSKILYSSNSFFWCPTREDPQGPVGELTLWTSLGVLDSTLNGTDFVENIPQNVPVNCEKPSVTHTRSEFGPNRIEQQNRVNFRKTILLFVLSSLSSSFGRDSYIDLPFSINKKFQRGP